MTFAALTTAVFARLTLYVGAMLVIGAVTMRFAAATDADVRADVFPTDHSLPIERAAWLLLLVAVAMLFYAQFREMELAFSADSVTMLLTQTAWGRGWSILALSISVGAIACVFSASRFIDALLALAVAIAMGGLGHPAADDGMPLLARAIDVTHVIGIGIWLGTLSMIPANASPRLWAQYSQIATIAAPLVVVSGVLASLRRLQLPPLADAIPVDVAPARFDQLVTQILTSDYGRLLLVKTALAVVVLGIGSTHRRRVLKERAPSGKSLRIEIAIAAVVLLVTAILTGTAPPGE